jgi:hypothetical protein
VDGTRCTPTRLSARPATVGSSPRKSCATPTRSTRPRTSTSVTVAATSCRPSLRPRTVGASGLMPQAPPRRPARSRRPADLLRAIYQQVKADARLGTVQATETTRHPQARGRAESTSGLLHRRSQVIVLTRRRIRPQPWPMPAALRAAVVNLSSVTSNLAPAGGVPRPRRPSSNGPPQQSRHTLGRDGAR